MRSRWTTGGDSCTAWQQNCGDACARHEPGEERPVQAEQGEERKNRPPTRGRDAERKKVAKHAERVPRKAAIVYHVPVPKTDTGGWGENPKAGGRSIVKELGKMAP